ncbi:MAG: hypothetical protein HC932_04935 [Thermales bacterium]|nr:hypothetical protein [Thermales bacterium]
MTKPETRTEEEVQGIIDSISRNYGISTNEYLRCYEESDCYNISLEDGIEDKELNFPNEILNLSKEIEGLDSIINSVKTETRPSKLYNELVDKGFNFIKEYDDESDGFVIKDYNPSGVVRFEKDKNNNIKNVNFQPYRSIFTNENDQIALDNLLQEREALFGKPEVIVDDGINNDSRVFFYPTKGLGFYNSTIYIAQ